MPKSKKSRLPLFDVRLRSQDKDTIVLKGPPDDAAPALFSGVVAMSVTEPIHIKRMKLKLYATLNIHWEEKYHNVKGQEFTRPVKFSRILFCFEWDPIDLERFLQTHNPLSSSFPTNIMGTLTNMNAGSSLSLDNTNGFRTGKLTCSKPGSATNLTSIGSSTDLSKNSSKPSSNLQKKKSGSSLSGLNLVSLNNSSSHNEAVVLQPGNYEFPFQTIIDGSVPESIDGHPYCSLVYRLQCSIERGRFSNPIISRKLIHIVRTLSADNPELSETVAVDNSWPNKVDYSISIPTKALAIGSSCQFDISLTPLSKRLKLGPIKIKLTEFSNFVTSTGSHTEEKVLTTKHIQKITHDAEGKDIWSDEAEVDSEGVFYRGHNMVLSQDRWEIQTTIQLPPSLEKITQDCDIANTAKIRHKFKFSISLINSDGHVSELRATLPVTIFISPFLPVKTKCLADFEDPFQYAAFEDASIYTKSENILFEHDDMKPAAMSSGINRTANDELPSSNVPFVNVNTQELMAPPNYNDYVYDKVFDSSLSALETNENEHQQWEQQQEQEQQLQQQQQQQQQQRQQQYNIIQDKDNGILNSSSTPHLEPTRRGKPVFSLSGDDVDEPEDHSPLFGPVISGPSFENGSQMPISQNNSSFIPALMSPGIVSPVQHLSRAASFIGDPVALTRKNSGYFTAQDVQDNKWKKMVNPPTYDTALNSEVNYEDLTPTYEEPPHTQGEINMNLDVLDSRLNHVHLSRSHGSANSIKTPGSKSLETSPSRLGHNSRSSSSAGLSNLNLYLPNIGLNRDRSHAAPNTSSASISRAQSSGNLFTLRNKRHGSSASLSMTASNINQSLTPHLVPPASKSGPTSPNNSSTNATSYFVHGHSPLIQGHIPYKVIGTTKDGDQQIMGKLSVPKAVYLMNDNKNLSFGDSVVSSVTENAHLRPDIPKLGQKVGKEEVQEKNHGALNKQKSGSFINLSFLNKQR